jgi:hypothetical protein
MANNYYTSRTSKLLKGFDKAAKHMRVAVAARYGGGFAETALTQARLEFEKLIPELPYIGGRKNRLTEMLVGSTWCLALHRVFRNHGKTAEETGAIIDATVRAQFGRIPKPLRALAGIYMSSGLYLGRLRKQAAQSQERTYPGNWVFDVIDGHGSGGGGADFDYGIDFAECGICKFYKDRDAEELIPYLCATDFPVSELLGTGLIRTTTLADGSERCNFRFKRGLPPGSTA